MKRRNKDNTEVIWGHEESINWRCELEVLLTKSSPQMSDFTWIEGFWALICPEVASLGPAPKGVFS